MQPRLLMNTTPQSQLVELTEETELENCVGGLLFLQVGSWQIGFVQVEGGERFGVRDSRDGAYYGL